MKRLSDLIPGYADGYTVQRNTAVSTNGTIIDLGPSLESWSIMEFPRIHISTTHKNRTYEVPYVPDQVAQAKYQV